MTFSKTKVVKCLNIAFILGLLSCVVSPFLSSCSTVYPTFTVTNAKQDWVANSTTWVNAIWKGYYFDDVNAPWEVHEIDIPPEHQNDIKLDVNKSRKIKDDANQTQSCSVYFNVLTTANPSAKPFDVHIIWTIKHTNFTKTSTITITPAKSNIININKDFVYTTQPNTDYDVDPNTFLNNSIQCINGIYSGTEADRSKIETHLTNDLIWYQYLIYVSLKCIYIDDSTSTYATLDDSTWKLHVDLEYNFVTKIFNYITLHAEAAATVHTILGMSFKGGIVVDYSWGLNDQANPVPGPKLMGAYTVNTTDYNAHYPQGYVPNKDPVYNPYAQDFLALVPQNPDSYQTYNIVINSPVYNFTTGQHMYFLSQPRFFGLEYTSGLKHIVIRSAKSPAPSEDSFRNWQFTPPSYTLSGMSYDFSESQWINKWEQMNIHQCYVDIAPNQTFSNYLAPGDKQKWAQAFMFSKNWTDVDFNNDLPTFIANKKAEYQNNDACLNDVGGNVPWKNINVYLPNQTEILLKDIPYYQVIQQSSTNWNVFPKSIDDGSNLATSHYNSQNESNIGYDQSTDRFTWFAMGLNYLFYTDNMESDGDNILFYNPEQLEQLNSNFINNPS